MDNDLPLFPPAGYPEDAGYKEETTSKDAAASVDAGTLRAEVLGCLIREGPLTADECAEKMRLSVLSIRPRFSELRAKGEVFDTGARRANASGRNAIVWDWEFTSAQERTYGQKE